MWWVYEMCRIMYRIMEMNPNDTFTMLVVMVNILAIIFYPLYLIIFYDNYNRIVFWILNILCGPNIWVCVVVYYIILIMCKINTSIYGDDEEKELCVRGK